MADVGAIATALKSTVETATGLRGWDYVPDDFQPPAFFVAPGEITRSSFETATAMGEMTIPFDLVVLMPRGSDRAGQSKLFDYVSFNTATSVWKAVKATPSLGLSETNAAVLRYRPLGIEEIAAYGYIGGSFEILVLTKGV